MATANKIQIFWIMTQSVCITIRYSIISLYLSIFGNRQDMDKTIHNWAGSILAPLKVNYKVYNPYQVKLLPNHPYILMSNHASHYDIPLIFMAVPGSIRMIAKKELFRIPLWGYAIKRAEFLAIDRNNPQQAIKDLEIVKDKMHSGIIPWVAPEGTRSRDGKLNLFKKGAFMLALQTNATIIPIGIRGSAKILPADTWNFSMGQDVEIYINPPIASTDYTIATRNELLKVVRQSIAEACGTPEA